MLFFSFLEISFVFGLTKRPSDGNHLGLFIFSQVFGCGKSKSCLPLCAGDVPGWWFRSKEFSKNDGEQHELVRFNFHISCKNMKVASGG